MEKEEKEEMEEMEEKEEKEEKVTEDKGLLQSEQYLLICTMSSGAQNSQSRKH